MSFSTSASTRPSSSTALDAVLETLLQMLLRALPMSSTTASNPGTHGLIKENAQLMYAALFLKATVDLLETEEPGPKLEAVQETAEAFVE